jgi:hypothetical protein
MKDKVPRALPAGLTKTQLAKALFVLDVRSENLSAEQRKASWLERKSVYMERSASLMKILANILERSRDNTT